VKVFKFCRYQSPPGRSLYVIEVPEEFSRTSSGI
jgi:hypothetical protein